jgi:PleD family two-component response regulator
MQASENISSYMNTMTKAKSKKILLVFDDQFETTTISQILLLNKYQVLHAKDEREAITIARKLKPDLIIFNPQSKKIDSAELLESVRSAPQTRRIPFLFVLESKDQIPSEAGDQRPQHSLVRPFARGEVALAVQKSLKRS